MRITRRSHAMPALVAAVALTLTGCGDHDQSQEVSASGVINGSGTQFREEVVDIEDLIGAPADEALGVIHSGSKDPRAANPTVSVNFTERPTTDENRTNFAGWSVIGMCVPEGHETAEGLPDGVNLQMLITKQDPESAGSRDALRQWRGVLTKICDDESRTSFIIRHER